MARHPKLVRTPGWESRLATVLHAEMTKPFAWGTADCLIQQAEVCRAMTGKQVFPKKLRTYSSAAGALKAELGP